jgi:putative ABC transport system permease protein
VSAGLWRVMRSAELSEAWLGPFRALLEAVDPLVPVVEIQTMDARIDGALRRERLLAMLGTLFGALALLLVAVGLYGLLTKIVAQRAREIGIRLALGGSRRSVVWIVLREGTWLAALGLAIGLGLAIVLTRFIGSELFGVSPTDPSTRAVAAGLLIAAGLASSLWSAIRAPSSGLSS